MSDKKKKKKEGGAGGGFWQHPYQFGVKKTDVEK